MGNYETKEKTDFLDMLFGMRTFEIKDLTTGEVGKGEGYNARC